MDIGGIITLIVALLYFVMHVLGAIRKDMHVLGAIRKDAPQQEEQPVVVVRPVKAAGKRAVPKPKPKPKSADIVLKIEEDESQYAFRRREMLSKKLAPQGEGKRFETAPGTFDAAQIVAPTIDPSVKPELESLTGIYEQDTSDSAKHSSAYLSNLAALLSKPEGIYHAVLLSEILNRPEHAQFSAERKSGHKSALAACFQQ